MRSVFIGFLLFFYSMLIAQVEFNNSTLPILVIDTNGETIPDEPKINVHLGVIYNGPNEINYLTDPFNEYDGTIGIEIRGQTSQFFPKQPYGFETRLDNGDNNNVPLLNMPEENDWVMHNPFSDKSLIRNVLAYKIGSELMEYAPRTRLCEVLINDNYQGIYVLTEKIKVDEGRVDIANLLPQDISGDEVTGGYLLKIDKPYQDLSLGWASLQGNGFNNTYFYYHDPKVDDLNFTQKVYIKNWFDSFENVLASDNFADPDNGYQQYIDMSSFVDFFLINEVSRNVDGYRLSSYMHKEKDSNGGKLKMGPIWDFNLAFGNADYCDGFKTEGWAFQFNEVCENDGFQVPFWWERMLEDEQMVNAIRVRWQSLRTDFLSDNNMISCINNTVASMGDAPERNFEQWPILNEYVWPNSYIGGNYLNEIQFLKDWLIERMHWMDANINELQVSISNVEYEDPVVQPNPFSNQLEIEYFAPAEQKIYLRMYNSVGALILEYNSIATSNGFNQAIVPTQFASGLYFFTLSTEFTQLSNGKLIKHD